MLFLHIPADHPNAQADKFPPTDMTVLAQPHSTVPKHCKNKTVAAKPHFQKPLVASDRAWLAFWLHSEAPTQRIVLTRTNALQSLITLSLHTHSSFRKPLSFLVQSDLLSFLAQVTTQSFPNMSLLCLHMSEPSCKTSCRENCLPCMSKTSRGSKHLSSSQVSAAKSRTNLRNKNLKGVTSKLLQKTPPFERSSWSS